MSFLLYNPLEAMILIIPIWIANINNINWKNKKLLLRVFIKDCYIIGILNLIVQLPLNFLFNTLFYIIYNSAFCVIFMISFLYVYQIKRFKKRNLIFIILILVLYTISSGIILNNSPIYIDYILGYNAFLSELLINLYARLVQFILIFLLGGTLMIRKFCKNTAKKNLKNSIAATLFGVGEPNISKKLKTEVKNSK